MRRRDQLTYDLGEPARRQLPSTPVLLLAIVILLAVLLVSWVAFGSRTPRAAPVAGPVSTFPPTPRSSTMVSSSPIPPGSDAGEALTVPEGSQQAAALFVQAWLDRDPKTRQPALTQVTAPALAEQLMLTDPANIPRATPRGAPMLLNASPYSAQFSQILSTGMRIQVYLVADPAARHGWLATSVERG